LKTVEILGKILILTWKKQSRNWSSNST